MFDVGQSFGMEAQMKHVWRIKMLEWSCEGRFCDQLEFIGHWTFQRIFHSEQYCHEQNSRVTFWLFLAMSCTKVSVLWWEHKNVGCPDDWHLFSPTAKHVVVFHTMNVHVNRDGNVYYDALRWEQVMEQVRGEGKMIVNCEHWWIYGVKWVRKGNCAKM